MTRSLFITLSILVSATFAVSAFAQTTSGTPTACMNGFLYNADGTVGGTCDSSSTGATAPAVASTPGNGGIFSCSAPGASSIAASSAIGGTFVPVFDAAVALNTGTQTYKECVLKEIAVQERLAATGGLIQQDYNLLATGRNGNPYWVVNYAQERGKVSDQAVVNTFNSGIYQTINPAYQNDVQRAVLRTYQTSTRAPQTALNCPNSGTWSAVTGNPTQNFSWNDVFAMTNPACDPVYAYTMAQDQLNANVAAAQDEWVTRLNWNNGIYDSKDANGNVVVPGIFLNAIGTQALTSSYRQLENIDDIGQMVGSYFRGMGSMLLSGPSSVAAVQQYLGQAAQQQQGSLANSVVNTALTNLYQIISWEQQYNDAQQQMASTITTAITQLRTAESACYQTITSDVCSSSIASSTASSTCTGKSGGTLTIATSTAFSNSVIKNASFADFAKVLSDRINISNQNLTTLNTILTAIQSSDPTTRNTGLQQLDTIAKSNLLHTQTNVNQAKDELTKLQAAVTDNTNGLVKKALDRWQGTDSDGNAGAIGWNGDTTSDTGWCNVPPPSSSPSTVQQQTLNNWTTAWTH